MRGSIKKQKCKDSYRITISLGYDYLSKKYKKHQETVREKNGTLKNA